MKAVAGKVVIGLSALVCVGWTLPPPVQSVIYSFCSSPECADGLNPDAALVADKEGSFFGTTFRGGSNGNGTVFRLSPPTKGEAKWTFNSIYSFRGQADGIVDGAMPGRLS